MIIKNIFNYLFIFNICSISCSSIYFTFSPFKENCGEYDDFEYDDPLNIKTPKFSTSSNNLENEEKYYNNDKFNFYYFKNLNDNVIKNNNGNCGYTAISMLLSFYDTYWNDNVISSSYESSYAYLNNFEDESSNYKIYNSPGISDNINLKIPSGTSSEQRNVLIHEFINKAIANKNSSLFGLLLSYSYDFKWFQEDDFLKDFPTTYDNLVYMLNRYINDNDYLANKISVKSNNVSNINSYSKIRNEVINEVQKGNPVIVAGNSHAMVAYYYDEINDIIYGHMGWGYDSTFYNIDDYVNTSDNSGIYYYAYLNISNLKHEHSKKYLIIQKSKIYCSCSLYSHIHNYAYKIIDTLSHEKHCICLDASINENHIFSSTYKVGINEYAVCKYCNYSKNISNIPTPIY